MGLTRQEGCAIVRHMMTLSDEDLLEIYQVAAAADTHEWSLTENSSGGGTLRRGYDGLPLKERHPQSHLQIVPLADAVFMAAVNPRVARLMAGELLRSRGVL